MDEMRRKLFNNFEFFWWGRSDDVVCTLEQLVQFVDSHDSNCFASCFDAIGGLVQPELLLFSLFLLRENFWDFRIFCSLQPSSTIAHTLTGRARRDRSIFSTPNDGIGARQWDGNYFHSVLFSIMRSSLPFLLTSLQFMVMARVFPRCFISFYDFIWSQRDGSRVVEEAKRCKVVALCCFTCLQTPRTGHVCVGT